MDRFGFVDTAGIDLGCEACATGLDHCHGTLIVHEDSALECTAAQCIRLDIARHQLMLGCGELGGCDCSQGASALAFAS